MKRADHRCEIERPKITLGARGKHIRLRAMIAFPKIKAAVGIAGADHLRIDDGEVTRHFEMTSAAQKSVSYRARSRQDGVVKMNGRRQHVARRTKSIKPDHKRIGGGGKVQPIDHHAKRDRRRVTGRDHALKTMQPRRHRLRLRLPRKADAIRIYVHIQLVPGMALWRRVNDDLKVAAAIGACVVIRSNSAVNSLPNSVASPGAAVMQKRTMARRAAASSSPMPRRRASMRSFSCAGVITGNISSRAPSSSAPTRNQRSSADKRKVTDRSRRSAALTPAAKNGTTMESACSCRTIAQASSALE